MRFSLIIYLFFVCINKENYWCWISLLGSVVLCIVSVSGVSVIFCPWTGVVFVYDTWLLKWQDGVIVWSYHSRIVFPFLLFIGLVKQNCITSKDRKTHQVIFLHLTHNYTPIITLPSPIPHHSSPLNITPLITHHLSITITSHLTTHHQQADITTSISLPSV